MCALSTAPAGLMFLSGVDLSHEIALSLIPGLQGLLALGLGIFMISGRGGAGELVPMRSTWRAIALVVIVLFGIAVFVLELKEEPQKLYTVATWPVLTVVAIYIQFKPSRHHFRNEDQWAVARSHEETTEALVRLFREQGMDVKTENSDVWVEIRREWQGDWRHRDAARHMKVQPFVHFLVDETQDGTRVTAFSGDTFVGAYDALKLADEMSETAVALAKERTGWRGHPAGAD